MKLVRYLVCRLTMNNVIFRGKRIAWITKLQFHYLANSVTVSRSWHQSNTRPDPIPVELGNLIYRFKWINCLMLQSLTTPWHLTKQGWNHSFIFGKNLGTRLNGPRHSGMFNLLLICHKRNVYIQRLDYILFICFQFKIQNWVDER